MARRRKMVLSSSLVLLLAGFLAGYAVASLGRAPAVLERPLPNEAAPFEEALPEAQSNPGGYSEPEMIFHGYLGIYNERIAIFRGHPPGGTLQHINEYEVRDDLRVPLEEGVPFHDTGELLRLLENFTS
jgi:hypothetical protein